MAGLPMIVVPVPWVRHLGVGLAASNLVVPLTFVGVVIVPHALG